MCFTALNAVSTKISNEVARGLGRKNLRCSKWCYCLYFNQAPPPPPPPPPTTQRGAIVFFLNPPPPPPLQMKNPHTMQANELNIGTREL